MQESVGLLVFLFSSFLKINSTLVSYRDLGAGGTF